MCVGVNVNVNVFQETIEKQLCDPQVLTPDFSKPDVSVESFYCLLNHKMKSMLSDTTNFHHEKALAMQYNLFCNRLILH